MKKENSDIYTFRPCYNSPVMLTFSYTYIILFKTKELNMLCGLKTALINSDSLFSTKSMIYFPLYFFLYLPNYDCSMFHKSKFLQNNRTFTVSNNVTYLYYLLILFV
jgi:hypothetical protein